MTPALRALFPCESESEIAEHIIRLRRDEIERECVERMDRAKQARILRDYHWWMMERE